MGQESTEHGQIIPISTWLFSGRLEPLVGLPEKKEKKLAETCPDKFRGDNAWSNYAMQHLSNIIDMANWKWKSNDAAERLRQFGYFSRILGTFNLRPEDKKAVAGWMLSEMLTEVPK